jgi:two-component system phosphate regulon sensor histidine kinase PhoR
VSHEFRSPLSSISQISELLNEDRWPSPERKRKGYEILSRESARLKRLVEGLLDFTRMEAGTAGYRLEPVQPEDLVRAVVEEFRPGANGATLDLKVSADLPGIRADGEALRRALWNLMENAVKYSPGTARVHVEAARDGAWLAIRVRDEGMGIPAEEQSRIFQKFYRGSEAKELKVKGTGIGLAMVRHIVEGHGGEIRVDSAPGRGSTFTILLPEEKET